ncbi:DNA-directed RNA polymerase subunit beta' [Candidatus Entotheonellaceae bacterium PAL068K]
MDSISTLFEKPKDPTSFSAIRIRIASPKKIRSWSYGEVKKPETINYRTFKPERDGLFCAKIFGPVKDWECNCGKYKRLKHRGVVCEKCGVEVIQSKVRRERLGHIELTCPVSHVWFFKGVPSRIGTLLDMSLRELEQILYFENYVVIDPRQTGLKEKELLTEERHRELVKEHGTGSFVSGMGAEAIRELLRRLEPEELETLAETLREEMGGTFSLQKRRKIVKRLKIVDAFRKSGNRPEWMILDVIPVIPPELRPLVPLDGGRFATSDLNDLYRRVINRNNRLSRLQELRAPDIIIRNEKRMLQEAVDALFDNGRRGRALRGPNKRPLKSLSDMLKGKQGRFRQNLLGKRVDYSGRSVIVVGPDLKLHQCGLPKRMALELFKPFIYHKLEEHGHVNTIKSARKMVEKELPEVWDVLDEIIREYPVMLNRAPTLHRLGIQAFEPVLVEGKAIRIHPLVCAAFNADFDGDQMAVHVPLSVEAQVEAKVLMLSINNILSAAHGKPLAIPSQDIIMGCYYLTKERGGSKGKGKLFASMQEALIAYNAGEVGLQARIRVRLDSEVVTTTVGRVVLSEVLPPAPGFGLTRVNRQMDKSALTSLVAECYQRVGKERTVQLLEALKDLGFYYATKSGLSIGIDNMHIPDMKERLVEEARRLVVDVENQYREGLITNGERYNKIVDIWAQVTEQISQELFKDLEREDLEVMHVENGHEARGDFNPIYIMHDSAARGGSQQIRQLAGMRGLMAKPSGEIMETPITANFREGLSVLQYFISTHGARKGLADTALKTANSGYLTRRLVDVAQDIIVRSQDCGTINGTTATALVQSGEIIESLGERILGRVAAKKVVDPYSDEVLVARNALIDEEAVKRVENAGIEHLEIRSVLTCELESGICAMCYGRNLATGALAEIGDAVGVVAAQSIGEPGTQLTMRTFHIGGTASRQVEQSILQAKNSGVVQYQNLRIVNRDGANVVMNRNGLLAIQDELGREKERYQVVYGARLRVKDGQQIERGEKLVEWDPYTLSILSEAGGQVAYGDIVEGVTMQEELDEQTGLSQKVILEHYDEKRQPRISVKDEKNTTVGRYLLPAGAHISVVEGDTISAGDVVAKLPRETTKTKDITGGLPRVAELFEARKPKEQAIISEIDGLVKFGDFQRGARKVVVTSESGKEHEYLISRGKYVNVHEGDRVRAGEPLMDGAANPHDILDILGEKELQKYLVNEIQEVYRLQGVQINDKHLEVIVKQMLKHVVVVEPGDTDFLVGEQVAKTIFTRRNQAVQHDGGIPARGKPILLGITKSSLSTESFISAASFQETTRVLTQAAISGMVDRLRGLKENVIMGRIIPAGTGIVPHEDDLQDHVVSKSEEAVLAEKQPVPGTDNRHGQDTAEVAVSAWSVEVAEGVD